ncbi:hypothetical protein AVEN_207942-1 [Araneus ventricosus]|uniref:Uncharacterized protein n=1 Tax=Araneus ventricosus TaxID=182803 RepID=A0A4Y2WVP0_ARAVE|nr:hypothetical protein AVEN_207942-1 [Araneus ventricosus]
MSMVLGLMMINVSMSMVMMVRFMVMVSMMSTGMESNMGWILIGGSGFVGLHCGPESLMVSYVVNFPVDASVVSETIASLNVMTIAMFMSVLRTMVVFDFISKFVGLGMVML